MSDVDPAAAGRDVAADDPEGATGGTVTWQLRPGSMDDVGGLTRLAATADLLDIGEVMLDESDFRADLRDPSVDVARDIRVVIDPGAPDADPLGYVMVEGRYTHGTVHPDARGRGIGTALLDWAERRRAEDVTDQTGPLRLGQTVADSAEGAIALLTGRGYTPSHTSWILRLLPDVDIPARPVAGITLRPATADDSAAAHRVVEDAFNEWIGRDPSPYETWQAHIDEDEDVSVLVATADDEGAEIVGVCVTIRYPGEGWVDKVAVRNDHRGRGIAQALLARTFGELRAEGRPQLGLSTDSRTGALDLYQKLGMVVTRSFTHLATEIDRAVEVS